MSKNEQFNYFYNFFTLILDIFLLLVFMVSEKVMCLKVMEFIVAFSYILSLNHIFKNINLTRQCWHTPLIPTLGGQREVNLCEFKASLVYRASSRTGNKVTPKLHCLDPASKAIDLPVITNY